MSGKGLGDGVAADASNDVAPSASGPFCMARTGDWRSLFDVSAEAKGRSGAWSRIVELNYQPEGHDRQPPQSTRTVAKLQVRRPWQWAPDLPVPHRGASSGRRV